MRRRPATTRHRTPRASRCSITTSIVVGKNYPISFQERPGDYFEPLRARLRDAVGRIRKLGADFLAHALLDSVIDHYFIALDRLGERIEKVEDAVIARPVAKTPGQIHALKREMLFVRRTVWPMREVLTSLRHLDTRSSPAGPASSCATCRTASSRSSMASTRSRRCTPGCSTTTGRRSAPAPTR